MALNELITRLGFIRIKPERSLLFVGHDRAAYEALSGVIEELQRRDSRMRIVLSSYEASTRQWLRDRFSGAVILDLPFRNRVSAEIYLRRLKVRGVVLVESVMPYRSHHLLAALKRSAVGVLTATGRDAAALPAHGVVRAASEALVCVCKSPIESLPAHVTGMTSADLADRLGVILARDLKTIREPNLLLRVAAAIPAKLAASPRWGRRAAWRLKRYDSIGDLKQRLGSPRVIMCLGNGPSSEESVLATLQKDSLFRVNNKWCGRHFLTQADVVFAGGKPSFRSISSSIFGVPTPDAERNLLLLRIYNPMVGRTEYFNALELGHSIGQYSWGHLRPTNGACMLATAVALAPDKIIVAGIDLFQHPAGSYPGNSTVPNSYSPGHNRDYELEFMMKIFSAYRGEIVIVGDILKKAWEEYQAEVGHLK